MFWKEKLLKKQSAMTVPNKATGDIIACKLETLQVVKN